MISTLALLVTLVLANFLARRAFRAVFSGRNANASDRGKTCRCGYDLTRLQLPRCPECGRVAHFDATADQMGLTNDELARIGEAQRRRRQREAENAPPPLPPKR